MRTTILEGFSDGVLAIVGRSEERQGGAAVAWSVSRNDLTGVIEITYRGTIAMEQVIDSTAEALAIAEGEGPQLFLSDLSDARSELSVIEIYSIPAQWEQLKANRGNRVAVVVPESAADPVDARFYENVSRNRGWLVRVFKERKEALEWLTGG
jgi:hypothetical protein